MLTKLLQAWRGLTSRRVEHVELSPVAAVAAPRDADSADVGAVDEPAYTADANLALDDADAAPTSDRTRDSETVVVVPMPRLDASVEGLTAELHRRAAALASELPNPAVVELLTDLTGSPTAVIRQLPAAAQRALALTQLTEPPVDRLTEVFEEDPTLAQALLLQANSGLYGAGRACLSVRDAIQRLGVGAVRSVLLGHTVSALLCRPGAAHASMVSDVWAHMVRTAPIARRLASPFNADAEEAYALGLLHDAGKLVVFDRLTTLRIEARRELPITSEELRRVLRELHEPLGALAAHSWGLGASAAEAIATHHRDALPAGRNALSEVLCVAEAADLASVRGTELDLAALWDRAKLGGSAVRVERALLAA